MKNMMWNIVLQAYFWFILLMPFLARAAIGGSNPGGIGGSNPSQGGTSGVSGRSFESPISQDSIGKVLQAILEIVVTLAFPLIVLAIIYTGFLFVSARGNKEKLETARRAFVWTVVGTLLILGASALSQLIGGTIGEIQRGF